MTVRVADSVDAKRAAAAERAVAAEKALAAERAVPVGSAADSEEAEMAADTHFLLLSIYPLK